MAEKLLFVDSDIFIILSASGLLEKLAGLLGYKPYQIRRLSALPHQLTRGRSFKDKYSKDVRTACHEYAENVAEISDRPQDDEQFQKLINVEDIDEGEALLFAHLIESESSLLTTGDKRALVAIAKHPDLSEIRASISGRVVPLEIALEMLVENMSVEEVASAIQEVRGSNKTLRVIFSEGNVTDPGQCKEA